MQRYVRVMMLVLVGLMMMGVPALAEEVCTVQDATAATQVTTSSAYLRVLCPLEGETAVTLTVRDEWGTLLYQRGYGACSGTFRSGEIHLPLEGDSCRYTVTVRTDGGEHAFTVIREAPMTTDSAVFAGGMTLRDMVGGAAYKYAVVLDMDALNQETLTVPMLSGDLQLGEVYFSVLDGKLTVSASLWAQGQIDKANVSIAPDALTAKTLGTNRFSGIRTRLGRTIDLSGTPYVAVMVQLTVTYNPATADPYSPTPYEEALLRDLRDDWNLMQLTTANEALGAGEPPAGRLAI